MYRLDRVKLEGGKLHTQFTLSSSELVLIDELTMTYLEGTCGCENRCSHGHSGTFT